MALAAVSVLALGGTAHAANDLIDGGQIKDGTVTTAKLRPGSVGPERLKDGAVTLRTLAPGVRAALGGSTGAGTAGATGPTGTVGATGGTGATGSAGATGPSGQAGASGATGATGVSGVTGPAGVSGATGMQGVTGPTGAAGVVPTYTAGGSLIAGAHAVTGTATIVNGGPASVTFSGSAAFSSVSSYTCTVASETFPPDFWVNPISANTIDFFSSTATTLTVYYTCIGN